ncbi:terminus macrodomain insulation protein YfbV [Psychrosphaera ytuae]|uniref:terminus macrodomain insulation protein YfbV n=1 Tax=Psychrosphaera ytuae TaxID=2820710 RepID=UPI001E29FB6E|nr:terminus macrodomain insulation protein YfbV [Psychrosphaera ytuae]
MTILYKTITLGYKFSQTWPKKEPYLQMFDQTKIIKLTDLAFVVSPAIAVATLWLQIDMLGMEYLHSSLAMALFVLSLPFQGYFMLGKQAKVRLPIGLQSWYRELEQKAKSEGLEPVKIKQNIEPLPAKPNSRLTYMDLALLLHTIFVARR